jgi:xanthine dehydrogenase YagT iron-sulfur-binding subunit
MAPVIRLSVNGEPREAAVRAEESAVEVLRDRLGLTGTKLVCGEGVCGACTVLLDGVPVTSCLVPATALDGREVRTIEGFGPELHPVQRAFIAHDALQCGYCTPGQIVSAAALVATSPHPSRDEVRHAMSGNLCRCGAYPRIEEAIATWRG